MKHLPNLLKQESSSASTLVHILLRMYYDPRPDYQAARPQVADRLLPYVASNDHTQSFANKYIGHVQARVGRPPGLHEVEDRQPIQEYRRLDTCRRRNLRWLREIRR